METTRASICFVLTLESIIEIRRRTWLQNQIKPKSWQWNNKPYYSERHNAHNSHVIQACGMCVPCRELASNFNESIRKIAINFRCRINRYIFSFVFGVCFFYIYKYLLLRWDGLLCAPWYIIVWFWLLCQSAPKKRKNEKEMEKWIVEVQIDCDKRDEGRSFHLTVACRM